MRCGRRAVKLTNVQRLEQAAMKNGFKPGVHEKHGLYIGHWENDTKQGNGRKFYRNKTVYEGQWVANKRHGYGVLLKKVDDHFVLIYEGLWINNRFFRGKWYEENGIYEGEFSTASARMKSGHGVMRWNDGAVYCGQWRDNLYNGAGRHVEATGNYYDGHWRGGLRHGEGVYVFADKGMSMTGIWVDGVPKISVVEHLDRGVLPSGTEDDDDDDDGGDHSVHPRTPIPIISKSDQESILEAYQLTKSEILKIL